MGDYRCDMAVSSSAAVIASEVREFVERYQAAWNGCDTAGMAQLITEDIVWADPALPEPARGIPAVQEFMRTSFRAFPDLRFGEPDPPALAVAGDVILWGWYMEGTHRGSIEPPGFAPTGRSMKVEGVDHWTMRDGRIARYRAFYDMNDVARQLGIVPAPGSRAERGMVALQRLQARLSSR
ncbi:MAG TPA: ester cyclase [Solirubrobacteraceae bacterium]|nr:ester cyclase [Solirubrobacteraceae bacterium]